MILVTGSAGFIGANLMPMLPAGSRGVDVDARVRGTLKEQLSGIKTVVHLAASVGVEASVADPQRSVADLNITLHILDCCRSLGVRVILASTAGALAAAPRSPYAAGKLAAETYAGAYAACCGLRTTVLRFANVYGPHSAHKSTAIPELCRALLTGKSFLRYGDGSQMRDFVYVEDICRGIVAATEREATGTYVLGSGELTSISLVARMLELISGRKLIVEQMPQRAGEAAPIVAGVDWSARAFFRPSTTLTEGLTATWRWFAAEHERGALIRKAEPLL